MISQRAEFPIVALSVKLYRVLLYTYPTKFQQEYGSHMIQVFEDCCLRTIHQGGMNGMLRLWAVTLFDFVQSVISEHAQKEIEMKKEMRPEDIRMAGWALMLASLMLIIGLYISSQGPWGLSMALLFLIGMTLLVVGMLGLRNRYGEKVGGFGKNILLTGLILGPLTSFIGLFIRYVDPWMISLAGPAVLFACLALFGVVALYKRPLPRWNVLPLLAGISYPVFVGNWLIGSSNSVPTVLVYFLVYTQYIALFLLGYILKSDVPEEIPATA